MCVLVMLLMYYVVDVCVSDVVDVLCCRCVCY
jgi:hypothetical protein